MVKEGYKIRHYILGMCMCLCLSLYFLSSGGREIRLFSLFRRNSVTSVDLDNFNTTTGCPMPDWDPFHPSVRKLYKKPKLPYKCGGKPSFLVAKPNASILLDGNKLWKHHSLKVKDVKCTYQEITRNPGNENHPTDDKITYSKPKNLVFAEPLGIEFLRVKCFKGKTTLNDEYLPLTPLKVLTEKKCEENTVQSEIREKLNVVILGIDSISKLNFVRHFKRTRQFLKQELKAFELKRYNKVADNTFPNLTPLLTGYFVKQYEKVKFYDDIDLVWKHYGDVGYRTLLAEDAPKMATYNYLKKGFKRPPADYYLRPFTLAVESSDMKKKSKVHCFADKMEMKVILDYVRSFTDTMKDRPYFVFAFIARLTHDKLNNAGYADEPVYDFLQYLHKTNVTNNSLVIFMSDHGIRFGKIRETYIGKFEERWPIMHLVFPKWFLQKYPHIERSLKSNEDKLTTPFDVHKTLLDVLQVVATGNYSGVTNSQVPYGISLFQNVSIQRTCEDANILPHWCTCQRLFSVSVKAKEVRRAADALVNWLNQKVKKHSSDCAVMSLSSVKDAHYSAKDKGSEIMFDYLLTLTVEPSNAVFEGTVRYFHSKYEVQGDVSRINHYGSEGDCVQDSTLRKYCYCAK